MIKITNISVMNFENAIRGMRNPMNSWNNKSDSVNCAEQCCDECIYLFDDEICHTSNLDFLIGDFIIGKNDRDLALKFIKAGTDHAKFLRQIFVSMDIEAPLYWWKEADQYKIGTTTNSCSTMHTIHKKSFSIDMFSVDSEELKQFYETNLIPELEKNRQLFLKTNDKKYWRNIIQLLPSSLNQLRTWTGSYANLRNMYHARKKHRLQEWRNFCEVLEKLPYSEFITIE